MDRIQSKTIDLLRFPLAVFVVLIHTSPTLNLAPVNEAEFPLISVGGIYNIIEILFTQTITHIAVPTFFLISGFLFFQRLSTWDWNLYKSKLRSRVKTLLLPYLCWITLSYISISCIPSLMMLFSGSSLTDAWNDFAENRCGLIDCYIGLKHIWQHHDWFGNEVIGYSNPIVPTFWFVRDLIIVTALSPLFYLFIKKTKVYGLLIMCICYLSNHDFEMTATFYYCTGAYIAINNKSVVDVAKKVKNYSLPISVVCLIACTYFAGRMTLCGYRLYPFYVLSGVWSAFYISSYFVEKRHFEPNRFLVQSCFFVYALHYISFTRDISGSSLIRYSYRIIENLLDGIPHVGMLRFFIPPLITIFICLGVFWCLQKYAPRLCSLLTGNRS